MPSQRLNNDRLVQLLGGAYTSTSLIASAQRCVNLVPEINPGDSETPVTHNLRPGLRSFAVPGVAGLGRGAYRATNGELFIVVGTGVYFVSSLGVATLLGSIAAGTSICYMVDDTSTMLLADGSVTGYEIVLTTHTFSAIADVNFLGANRFDFLDTFVLSNVPATQEFQSTLSNVLTWDPLYFASKTGFSDLLVTLAVVHREIWLLGSLTSEVWFNAGNAGFPFAIFPGVFFQHGIAALASLATHGENLFWLEQDKNGDRIVVEGKQYAVDRISTYAIEQELKKYTVVSDAVGFCYKQKGHIFYVLTFPTADKTWVYDKQTLLWHEETWIDANGLEHRSRLVAAANAYDKNLGLDWETGTVYVIDPTVYTDMEQPIVRRRGFPHMVSQGNQVSYGSFRADMQAGEALDNATDTSVFLRFSDDRGKTWGNPLEQSLGAGGKFLVQPQWWRLGRARDRVFEIFWSAPQLTGLNGAWIDPIPLGN